MPATRKQQLSQREIWDDSALQQSWNAAQAEYQKYHSIHARGEDVEKLLDQLEAEELEQEGRQINSESPEMDDFQAPAEHEVSVSVANGINESHESMEIEAAGNPNIFETTNVASPQVQTVTGDPSAPQDMNLSAIPSALLGSVQDDALKNLMLSWYYAGYYLGVYEGKQNAVQSTEQQEDSGAGEQS